MLGETGISVKSQVMMYKVLVQAALLYGSEIWVFADSMMIVLEGFHHMISRQVVAIIVQMEDVKE